MNESNGQKLSEYDLNITVGDGKYTVRAKNGTDFHALRYGEYWRDLTGDNLIFALAQQIQLQSEYINLLGEELDEVVPLAAGHGWKSSRYEAGKALREKIGMKE